MAEPVMPGSTLSLQWAGTWEGASRQPSTAPTPLYQSVLHYFYHSYWFQYPCKWAFHTPGLSVPWSTLLVHSSVSWMPVSCPLSSQTSSSSTMLIFRGDLIFLHCDIQATGGIFIFIFIFINCQISYRLTSASGFDGVTMIGHTLSQ